MLLLIAARAAAPPADEVPASMQAWGSMAPLMAGGLELYESEGEAWNVAEWQVASAPAPPPSSPPSPPPLAPASEPAAPHRRRHCRRHRLRLCPSATII